MPWRRDRLSIRVFLGFCGGSAGKESACNAGDPGWITGSERSAGEGTGYPLQYSLASMVVQLVKNCLQCGRPGFHPWVGKIPWRRESLPTLVFWPGEFHGLYSPWGRKELDTTKRLSFFLFIGLLRYTTLHAIGLWNCTSYSESLLNKILAKTISVSEYNLSWNKTLDRISD